MIIEWKDSMSVGHDGIDTQHKRLVEFINELGAAMQRGEGSIKVGKIINNMASYTISHFEFEEELMHKVGYPKFEEHQAKHEFLVRKVNDARLTFERGGEVNSKTLLNFLTKWLFEHIMKSDMDYSSYLK